MYGQQANLLALAARRELSLPNLPTYSTNLVRDVTKEIRDLERDRNNILASYNTQSTQGSGSSQFNPSYDPAERSATTCALLVQHLAVRRNKRCLMAYHRTRTDKLEAMCWEGRDVHDAQAPTSGTSSNGAENDAKNSLSAEEQQYLEGYSVLLASQKGEWTDIDLAGSLDPPKDIFVEVRVLRDAGEIQTEYGSITLTKNSQLYVLLSNVEHLIQQGYLQRLT